VTALTSFGNNTQITFEAAKRHGGFDRLLAVPK
jgi:hypothetical protein